MTCIRQRRGRHIEGEQDVDGSSREGLEIERRERGQFSSSQILTSSVQSCVAPSPSPGHVDGRALARVVHIASTLRVGRVLLQRCWYFAKGS